MPAPADCASGKRHYQNAAQKRTPARVVTQSGVQKTHTSTRGNGEQTKSMLQALTRGTVGNAAVQRSVCAGSESRSQRCAVVAVHRPMHTHQQTARRHTWILGAGATRLRNSQKKTPRSNRLQGSTRGSVQQAQSSQCRESTHGCEGTTSASLGGAGLPSIGAVSQLKTSGPPVVHDVLVAQEPGVSLQDVLDNTRLIAGHG